MNGGGAVTAPLSTSATTSGKVAPGTSPERLSARTVLALALWFGLLTGYMEVACVTGAAYGAGIFLSYWGWHRLWMTPVADAVLFLFPGFVFALVARRRGVGISLRLCVTTFCFLSTLSLALFFEHQIHRVAIVIFSAGVGFQVGRIAGVKHTWFRRTMVRTLPAMAAMLIVLGAGLVAWQRLAERNAVKGVAQAEPDSPNVLLLILDTVRSMDLSLNGYVRQTSPQLQRFATRGVTFDVAISAAPWTLPSHAAMFTGRYPFETFAYFRTALDGRYPTLAEVLRARGYKTAGFVANTEYAGRATGLARGFIHYEDYEPSIGYLATSSSLVRYLSARPTVQKLLRYYELPGRKDARTINAAFLNWQRRNNDRPFFAFLNYFDAHAPYLPPEPFDTLFGGSKKRHLLLQRERYVRTSSPKLKPYVEGEHKAYDQSIAALDDQLGQLFRELEQRRLLSNTIVVVTADHGEEFGEHDILGHAYNVNTTLLHVPLVIVAPKGVPVGKRIDGPVSLRDLPATILDLSGVEDRNGIPGRSLSVHWAGVSFTSPPAISSEAGMVSLVAGRFHYIRVSDSDEKLFDYTEDPAEQNNLANTDAGRRMLPAFRSSVPAFFAKNRPWLTK